VLGIGGSLDDNSSWYNDLSGDNTATASREFEAIAVLIHHHAVATAICRLDLIRE
jgi:hypothetical protein